MPPSPPSRRPNRTPLAIGLVVMALLFALRCPIQSAVNRLVARWTARKTLMTWGLAPTRENIHLYLTSLHTPTPSRAPVPASDLPAIPPDAPFSGHWRYGDLFRNHGLSIGVYIHALPLPDGLADLIGDHPAGPGNTLTLRLLRSRRDLVESFARDAVVLYFGHANFGKGILFDPRSGEAPIPMGRDTLLVPERHLAPGDEVLGRLDNGLIRIRGGADGLKDLDVQCNVFGYLGCRTDPYFRDVWQAHVPCVDFVATTYVTHSVDAAPGILRTWISGLQRGQTLAAIVDDLNRNQSAAILFGRMSETTRYRNPDHHPDRLFTY